MLGRATITQIILESKKMCKTLFHILMSGWNCTGLTRLVTRSNSNILIWFLAKRLRNSFDIMLKHKQSILFVVLWLLKTYIFTWTEMSLSESQVWAQNLSLTRDCAERHSVHAKCKKVKRIKAIRYTHGWAPMSASKVKKSAEIKTLENNLQSHFCTRWTESVVLRVLLQARLKNGTKSAIYH